MRIVRISLGFLAALLVVLHGCESKQIRSTQYLTEFQNRAINPLSGDALADSKGWVYKRSKETGSWAKVIPGRCPQWLPDGKRFYYFLDVGYDGCRSQLWSADRNGEARLRMSTSDYFARRSPAVSEDGRRLAWHYSTCHASGSWEDIKVVCLNSVDEQAEETVVLRCQPATKIEGITWGADNSLSVMMNGQLKEVETVGKGIKPLP